MRIAELMIALAIYFLLSGLSCAAEIRIHSSEGVRVIVTPDPEIAGSTDKWVRQYELPRNTEKGEAKRAPANRKRLKGTKARGEIRPRFRNISPANEKSYNVAYVERRLNGYQTSIQTMPGHDKAALIDLAKTYLGSPYKLGGNNSTGIDCSAFVKQVFAAFDIELPRTARAQFAAGTRINREELTTGDLIFFRRGRNKSPSHVGIFMENDKFIHASVRNGGGVRIDSLEDGYYKHAFMGASKVLQ